MKITSVREISGDFANFVKGIKGGMYKFILLADYFEFETEPLQGFDFRFENLMDVFKATAYPEDKLAGSLEDIEYEEAYRLIRECLAFREMDDSLRIDQDFSEEVLGPRMKEFFSILSDYKIIPPFKCYVFFADSGTLFDPVISWGFCLIFLSEATRAGVLVFACPII